MAAEETQAHLAAPDPEAFARLYDACHPGVYAYAACRVEERSAAEEITAAAFRRAIEVASQAGFDPQVLGSFIFRVAASAVVDHARRSRVTLPHGVRAGDFDRDTDHRRAAGSRTDELAARAFAAAIDRRALRRAVERLPGPDRRLIVLHYLDGLTIDEQCAALGWARATFTRRLHGALRALHAVLADEATNAA